MSTLALPSGSERPIVSVIIPARDEGERLSAVLDDLAAQRIEGPFEVVVADGSAGQETWRMLCERASSKRDPFALIVVKNREGSIPHGLNRCVEAAHAELVVRVDAHSRVPMNYVQTMIDVLRTPGVDIAGGQVYVRPANESLVARIIAWSLNSALGNGGVTPSRSALGEPRRVRHAPLACYAREVWKAIDGYDERLPCNEDFDFDYRAGRAGFQVWAYPNPVYEAIARGSLRGLVQQRFRYGYWKARTVKKHPGTLSKPQLVPVTGLPVALMTGALVAAEELPLEVAILGVGLYAAAVSLLLFVTFAALRLGAAASPRHVALRAIELPLALLYANVAMIVIHVGWAAGFWCGTLRSAPRGGPVTQRRPPVELPLPTGVSAALAFSGESVQNDLGKKAS